MNTDMKEMTIFNHEKNQIGDKIQTKDREITIVDKFEEPLVLVLENVLSAEECEKLIECSKNRLKRSKIGSSRDENNLRTSSGMFFEEAENETITKIEKRVSEIMSIPVEHGEGLQILNYKVGQEYKPHLDYFTSKGKPVENPRISTLVMFLNDVEEGGATEFPSLNFSAPPKKGSAVYFEYFYNDTNLNELTLHAGTPVVKGEKWVATQFMRRKRVNSRK